MQATRATLCFLPRAPTARLTPCAAGYFIEGASLAASARVQTFDDAFTLTE